jgi:hypothetical protein
METVGKRSWCRSEAEVIAALGGTGRLSARLGFMQSRVANWVNRGIPQNAWKAVARIAKEDGLRLRINGVVLRDIAERRAGISSGSPANSETDMRCSA